MTEPKTHPANSTPPPERPAAPLVTRRRLLVAGGFQALTAGSLSAAAHAAETRSPALGRPLPAASASKVRPAVSDQAVLFPLSAVRLLEGPLRDGQDLNRRYLLTLEPDRLLSWFRREAGLDPKAPPYRGWESEAPLLPGHILGFYLSGASMMLQATGDPELRHRLDYLVSELEQVQAKHGDGYALAVPGGKRLFAEVAHGKIEIGGLPWTGYQINGQFEPTYTLNKIMLGLYQVVLAIGSGKARQVLVRLADWFGNSVLDHLSAAQTQTLLDCEHGSLHESFADVYRLTGDKKYLTWARRLCHERMLAPLAAGNGAFLTHYHANTQIPKFTGFSSVYSLTGHSQLDRAAVNFWDEVVERRSWVIGGNSAAEHFFDPKETARALHEPAGPESCNTVNMLRLTESLFRTHPSGRLIDYYERALYNHLLAAHDPERGMFVYYTALQPGSYRVYSDAYDSMWCCVGTGLEVPGKYGQMIYTHSPDRQSLDVHLFIASELHWDERGVTVRQETRFPDEAATRLTVACRRPGTRFTLRVRHPEWVVAGRLRVTVNGAPLTVRTNPGEYAEIPREWHSGDVVRVDLPMRTVAEPLPGAPRYVSLRHGPIVLAGALGRRGLEKRDFWQIEDTVARKAVPEASVPAFVMSSPAEIASRVKPMAGRSLTFRVEGLARPDGQPATDVELIPFFRCHFQRYAVYWQSFTPEEMRAEQSRRAEEERRERALDARTLDRVRIGDPTSETTHHLQGANTHTGPGAYGERLETRWRDASDGGWFSYELSIPPDRPVVLRCSFWGRERGARTFDVVAGGKTLAMVTLGDTGKDDFYDRDFPLPSELLHGTSRITVRFQARPGNTAGGLFDLRVLLPDR